VPRQIDPDDFDAALEQLGSRADRVYLHVDLDALDESEARANEYAAPGGPSLARLRDCVRQTTQNFGLEAAALTAYDPGCDPGERVLQAAREIIKDLAQGLRPGNEAPNSG